MKITASHNDFTAILEPDEAGGFAAFCAEVPGANGQGDTEQAAIDNLVAAIKLMLQCHRDEAFSEMSEDARCVKVSIHEEVQAASASSGTRMRAAS